VSGKRGNGEGTIYRRADGRWEAGVAYTDQDGRSRRVRLYGKTRSEARAKLDAARRRLADGAPARDANVTLIVFVEEWIAGPLAASSRKTTTKENYATIARVHLASTSLGAMTLARLRPTDIERFLVARRAEKSASTVRTIYTVLRAVLDTAVRDGLVARNAAAAVGRTSRG
jgi:integrase